VAFDTTPDGDAADSLVGPDFNESIVPECGHPVIDKEPIFLQICRLNDPDDQESSEEVYQFDLGSGCSLQSVSYGGGDTGGGLVTETYTYLAFNTFGITYIP
jgi:hypothetical protein